MATLCSDTQCCERDSLARTLQWQMLQMLVKKRDDPFQALLQHQTYANVDRTMTSDLEWQALVSRADCVPAIPWPCGNEEISRFPLQQINTGNNCANGMATISSLDLNTSQYTESGTNGASPPVQPDFSRRTRPETVSNPNLKSVPEGS